MTGKQLRKILVGLDGSDRAISVVKYLGNMASLKTCHVTLLSVHDEISQAYRELRRHRSRTKRTVENGGVLYGAGDQ